jgi:hypothetical protein
MSGEKKNIKPKLNEGKYVFCSVENIEKIEIKNLVGSFKENEGYTIILSKKEAINLGLTYSFVAAWITLTINSSLESVGLTSSFSNALARQGISCNVIAGYFHDHIFVKFDDRNTAMRILNNLKF